MRKLKKLSDWRSYDQIADVYDRVWAARFEEVARAMAAAMPDCRHERTLDIGTGTGIVPAIFAEVVAKPSLSVGCDIAPRMLRRAKARMPELHVVAGDATALPFQADVFDLATASFVLSHVHEYRTALQEARRVLKLSGILAVSNWSAASDEPSETWSRCLADAISKPEAERALEEVAPNENYFSEKENLEAALNDSGFAIVHSESVDLHFQLTAEQFVEDRAINSAGRLTRHLLGSEGWFNLRRAVADVLRARFGESIQYSRRALIMVGRKQ